MVAPQRTPAGGPQRRAGGRVATGRPGGPWQAPNPERRRSDGVRGWGAGRPLVPSGVRGGPVTRPASRPPGLSCAARRGGGGGGHGVCRSVGRWSARSPSSDRPFLVQPPPPCPRPDLTPNKKNKQLDDIRGDANARRSRRAPTGPPPTGPAETAPPRTAGGVDGGDGDGGGGGDGRWRTSAPRRYP